MVTYLFGAGASAPTIPLATGLKESMIQFQIELQEHISKINYENTSIEVDKQSYYYKRTAEVLLEKITFFNNRIKNFSTVDTYAKMLKIQEHIDILKDLKLIMTSYFIWQQALSVAVTCNYAQTKKELNEMITSLSNRIMELESKIRTLESAVNSQNQEIAVLKTEIEEAQKISSAVAEKSPTQVNETTKPAASPEKRRCKAITASGKQCSRDAQDGSDYCWQHKKTYEPSSTNSNSGSSTYKSKSSSSSGSGRTIHTGPRGGKYYINSSGKKVYIKR